ncbi:MAG: hypothetical protein GY874_11545 [Desulfobacteraceae bacterium]|nr:hypothetical protein [Desulfobacteraceae bacterium]
MHIRQLLLVHPNRSYRGLIKKFIYADLSDVAVEEIDKAQIALDTLREKQFDIILVSDELPDMDVTEFKQILKTEKIGNDIPLILIAENENKTNTNELARQFKYVVHVRIRPADLILAINAACNPRSFRKDQRFYFPNTQVLLEINGLKQKANLLNLSQGGVYIEINTRTPEILVKDTICLSLFIVHQDREYRIENIACKLQRLNITGWNEKNAPLNMRAGLIFLELNKTSKELFSRLLTTAAGDNLIKGT